ncbi:hypothetical protein QOT17_003683 [Balamuthia mandrillaris]
MDIIPARTLELVEPGEVTTLCFHPDRPSIYLALTDRILAYDLLTNTVTGRAKVDRGARITHLVTSNDYLVAATDDGHIYTFEGEYANPTHVGAMGLSCVFSPPKSPEKRAIQGLCISPIMPWLFYSKAMTREINVIDLQAKTKSSWKMETKKPVAAFACHPIQPLLVVANTDNLIRVWDYKNKRLASQSDDFAGLAMKGGLTGSSVCKILFYPKKEILIAIGRDGLIVVWEIAKNSTLTCYGGRKISTKQGMIEGAFFHHTLPFFSTISTQGELRSWKLDIAAKKIPVQPAGYTQPFNALSTEMERRLQRLGAFSKNFHPPSLRATDVILHDELNYMAFSYDLTKQGTTGDHLLTSPLQRNHYVVHSLLSRTEPLLVLPKVDTLDLPPLFFQEEKFAFDYPQSKFHFVDSTKIISHSIIERNNLLEADLPEHEFDKTCALHTTRFHYSPKQKQYLVFYQSFSMVDPGSSKSLDHLLLPDSPTSSDSDVSKTSTSTMEPRSNYFYALVYGGPDREAENMSNLRRGRDGCFIGATNLEYVTLAENGEAITIRNIPSSEVKNQYEIRLKAPMSRIFHTPLSNERAIFFFDENNYQLILSMNAVTGSNAVSEFAPCIQSQEQLEAYHRHHHHHKKESNNNNDDVEDDDDEDEAENAASKKVANTKPIFNPHKHLLQLSREQRERVLDVKWKTYAHSAKYHLAAILTTTSIRIISVTLQGEIELLCSVHAPQDYIQLDRSNDRQQNNNLYFQSIYWVGNAVLCTTPSHLQYVTANGALRPLSSLENTGAVIATVMNDRLLYATAYKDRTQIRVLPVGLLEPLLLGEVCLPNHLLPSQSHLRSTLARLVERFDGRRITPYLVDQLDKRGFPDLALALVEKSPRFQILHKHYLALRALSFRKALQFLVDAHKKCSDYPKLSYQSPLHSKFLNTGKIAVKYGQFGVAEQCYATTKDFYSLLYIYAINGNRDKIKALQEQVKKEGSLVSSSASSPVAGSKGGLSKNKGKEKALLTKPSKQVTIDDRNWQKLDEVNTTLFTLEDACQVYLDNLKENERVEPLDWAYETPGTNSHWNIMRGTTSIVRVRKEDGSKGSVAPMQLQNVNQWLNSKVDWNILFISTTYRNSGPDTQEAGDGHAEDSVVGEGTANLAPPSRLDYIRTKYKTVTDSSSPTLRRSLSDENLPKFNPTSTEEVSDSDSEPDSESESFSEATSMGGRSVGVVGTNFNVLSEDSNAEDEDDDSTSSSTSTHGKKLRTASSPPINNDSGSTSPRPGTTTPASPEEERDVSEKGDAREKERESNRDHSEGASSARSSTRDRSKRKRQKGRTRSAASSILSLREDTFEGSFTDRTQDDVDEDEVDEEVNQDAAKHVSSADHSKFKFELPTPHLGLPATVAIPPLGVPRVRKTTSSEYITSCMQNFEKGFLSAALEDAEASIRHLRTEKDSAAKRREMKFSVAYMLALTLLIDIKRLDKLQQGTLENGDGSSSTNNHPPAKMIATKNTTSRTSFSSFSEEGSSMTTTSSSTATANKSLGFLSKCLAEIPLAPPHREICQRIAIEYNTKEGNHAYVRELIAADMLNEDLLVRPPPPTKRTGDRARAAAYPPDREELKERSKEAGSKGGANATLPSYCCPHCSYTSVPLSNKCESCNNRVRFCFKTQDLIRSKTFYQCPYCDAFYKEDVGKCRFCGLHNAEKQEIP